MPPRLKSDYHIADPIQCILTDVDGVMTDGRIVYDAAGLETKRFHVRDGIAIKLWMKSGFQFGIVTARTSDIVKKRASELGIEHVSQGTESKLPAAEQMLEAMGCTVSQTCYVGDDLPDLPIMRRVGLAVAPSDAATDARNAAHWILRSSGGDAALRELIERLMRAKQRWEEHVRS